MMVWPASPLLSLAAIFIGCPVSLALAIVFDHVRDQIDPSDPLAIDHQEGSTPARSPRVSDLAGTPWAKNASHQTKE
jgi:hypothetical protein